MHTIENKNTKTLVKEISETSEIFFGKRIFFDLEFTGLNQNADIISAGFVSENNEELYVEFDDYDSNKCDNWVKKHVITHLTEKKRCNRREALQKVLNYFQKVRKLGERIILISDCLSYDWILLNELWGGALKIPVYLYYIPIDISTMFYIKGIDPDIDREMFIGIKDKSKKHNAIWDAKVIKMCFEKLITVDDNGV